MQETTDEDLRRLEGELARCCGGFPEVLHLKVSGDVPMELQAQLPYLDFHSNKAMSSNPLMGKYLHLKGNAPLTPNPPLCCAIETPSHGSMPGSVALLLLQCPSSRMRSGGLGEGEGEEGEGGGGCAALSRCQVLLLGGWKEGLNLQSCLSCTLRSVQAPAAHVEARELRSRRSHRVPQDRLRQQNVNGRRGGAAQA